MIEPKNDEVNAVKEGSEVILYEENQNENQRLDNMVAVSTDICNNQDVDIVDNHEIIDNIEVKLVHTDSESSEPVSSSVASKSTDEVATIPSLDTPDADISIHPEPEKSKDSSPSDIPVPSSSSDVPDSPSSFIYQVKWVKWKGGKYAIITQNENGPCPLLSIVNILLLRGKLSLPEGCEVISAEQLLEYLADLLLSLPSPKVTTDQRVLDFQHNMNDAIAILHKLQTGLDVNVKFTGVEHFEYTPECIIFDLLGIRLYHGWLVDPQTEAAVAVGSNSYNQLVELIISNRSNQDSASVSMALVAQQFLEESASQLTYHGLCELNSALSDGELAVFFRNNHFSTVHKSGTELFLLVTDQGFLHQENVVWETLENIEGDTEFVDHDFKTVQEFKGAGVRLQGEPLTGEMRVEQDHLLAVNLAREDQEGRDRDKQWQQFKDKHLGNTEGLTDEELAARLQEAENLAAAEEARQEPKERGDNSERRSAREQGPTNPIGPKQKKDKNCVIL